MQWKRTKQKKNTHNMIFFLLLLLCVRFVLKTNRNYIHSRTREYTKKKNETMMPSSSLCWQIVYVRLVHLSLVYHHYICVWIGCRIASLQHELNEPEQIASERDKLTADKRGKYTLRICDAFHETNCVKEEEKIHAHTFPTKCQDDTAEYDFTAEQTKLISNFNFIFFFFFLNMMPNLLAFICSNANFHYWS